MNTTAAVWIAKGNNYVAEATRSMQSFKAHHSNTKCILCGFDKPNISILFDRVIMHSYDESKPFYFNLVSLYPTLLDIADTIFLFDTDTYTCMPFIDEILTVLTRFDFLGAHAPGRRTANSYYNLPDAFPEINIGFNAFNSNTSVLELFLLWKKNYVAHIETHYYNNDQAPLRDALWNWSGKFYVLPPEYNFRFGFGGQVRGSVRLLHGRSSNIAQLAQQINSSNSIRTYNRGELQ